MPIAPGNNEVQSVKRQRLSRLQKMLLVETVKQPSGKPHTRDIERALQLKSSIRTYSSNVRKTFHLMEKKGLVRIYRRNDLQLMVLLTAEGQSLANQLIKEENRTDCLNDVAGEEHLPYRKTPKDGTKLVSISLLGQEYITRQAALVIYAQGNTGLKLWLEENETVTIHGSLSTTVELYRMCYQTGLPVHTVALVADDMPTTAAEEAGRA